MKTYNAPTLCEYGHVGALTGIFGSDLTQDQSYNPDGKVIDEGIGSIDQCATPNQVQCLGNRK